MTDHRIHLRRAWEGEFPPEDGARRVDLPASWEEGQAPARLVRRFNAPSPGPGEAVALEIQDVPGLKAAHLNGAPLPLSAEGGPCLIRLGPLIPSGNRLVLELDPAAVPPANPWGRIALRIGPGVADAGRAD